MAEHTPTPWAYRPHRHDDWGWIRATSVNGELAPLVAMARSGSWESAAFFDEHRANKTDPYEANAAFIVKAVNNHEALIETLHGLIIGATCEVNEKGAGGFMLARLSDAKKLLGEVAPDRLQALVGGARE